MIISYLFKTFSYQYFFIRRLSTNFNLKFCSYYPAFKNMNSKPPNILVYTGDNRPLLFKEIYRNLQKCLRDRYTIYHLLESEIYEQPWMENSLLLIVSSEVIKNNTARVFETYLKNFGSILLICSKFNDYFVGNKCFQILDNETSISVNFKADSDIILYRGKYTYDTCGSILYYDTSKKPVIYKINLNKNILVCSEVYLDRDLKHSNQPLRYNINDHLLILKCILFEEFGLEIKDDYEAPQLTPGNYICKNEFKSSKENLGKAELVDSSKMCLFHECKLNYFNELIKLPIHYCKHSFHPLSFNINMFYSKLDSEVYGHQLVYFPVITSTMDVAEQLSEYEGIVIIADCQISGKGRGRNKWVSPKGCAMFTLHFTVSLNTQLGKRMSLLQHISALAVVHGIRSQSAYKDLEIKIKWPNDIYYNEFKLGGLIATSVIQRDTAHVFVGWGINVENNYPTTCLNDIIDKHNLINLSSLSHLCVEEVIAYTLSQMEYLVRDFIQHGPEKFFTLYYSYWMHGDQKVTLKNVNEEVFVIGLDDYGFLKVKTKKGETLTLQPDGNRFDITKNLIYSI